MKINTLFTNLMSNSINKRTPTNNPREGETLNEKTTHSSSTTAASSPLNEASTEQQRLFILRMLANKKINIEEAQKSQEKWLRVVYIADGFWRIGKWII